MIVADDRAVGSDGIHLCAIPVLLVLILLSGSVSALDEFTDDNWFYRTYSGLTEVPDDIPKESVGVYLNNNYLTSIPR